VRAHFAAELVRTRRPGFATVYLTGLDHIQHLYGPDTPKAHDALERIDAMVAEVAAAARSVDPEADIVVVSDHGFAPVTKDVNLFGLFEAAGLLKLDAARKRVIQWDAEPWIAGGSAGVVLARPKDPALRARVESLLATMLADPELGIARIGDEAALRAAGASPDMSYMIFFKLDFEAGKNPAAPKVGPSFVRGMHGYDPAEPAMRATFIAAGPNLPRRGNLGEIDMRSIAPYVADLLKIPFSPACHGV
jgi:predicted AlkP superfamily pyrophosphatase or phosphodiesterase